MATVKGYIEATSRGGRGLKVGDTWYGAFKIEQTAGVGQGDTVEFESVVNAKGYNDIKGQVKKVPQSNSVSAQSGGSTRAPTSLPDIERQMMIVRQNALTNAVAFTSHFEGGTATVADVIGVAQKFELYTSGRLGGKNEDLDKVHENYVPF